MTEGRPNLHELALAYRNGDADAGWAFVTSPQIEALIRRQKGTWSRRSYVKEEHLEDLASDLRLRVLTKVKDPGFVLPTYDRPELREAALVAYFGAHLQHLSKEAMRTIVGPNVGRTGTRADADIEFSQLEQDGEDGIEGLALAALTDPIEAMDKNRRLRLLAMVRHHFHTDEEARLGYAALSVVAQGIDNWGEVAEAVGLGAARSRQARTLALRFRNILKAAMLDSGEHVGYRVVGVYTSATEAGVTLLSDTGSFQTWAIEDRSDVSGDALVKRLRAILSDDTNIVTFAALNAEDHSSVMRISAMRALRGSEVIVERYGIAWLEAYVAQKVQGYATALVSHTKARNGVDARRRSMLLAQTKRAECQILCGRAA